MHRPKLEIKVKQSLGQKVYVYKPIKNFFCVNDKNTSTDGNRKVKVKQSLGKYVFEYTSINIIFRVIDKHTQKCRNE